MTTNTFDFAAPIDGLILEGRKPVAQPFQDWACREGLPSIRRTGKFSLEPETFALPLPVDFPDALHQLGVTMIKLAEVNEAYAKTKAQRDAALAEKAQAEAEVARLEALLNIAPSPRPQRRNAR